MFWFDFVGSALGFVGSVIFSAALLKGKQQIEDETATYFNSNPYLSDGEKSAQPLYRVAFALIIAGFSIIVGGQLASLVNSHAVLIGLLISTSMTVSGYLATLILLNAKRGTHERRRIEVARKNFRSRVESNRLEMRRDNEATNAANIFKQFHTVIHIDLEERLKQIPYSEAAAERAHIEELKSSTTLDQLIAACDSYLESK